MAPDLEHRFGGPWTDEKLQVVSKYLGFYTEALKNQFWDLVYIDAFAGTGSREFDDEDGATQSSEGSAILAMQIETPFDEYVFIERDPEKASELARKLQEKPGLNVTVIVGDANEKLLKFLKKWDKLKKRGVIFLDPFAMSVEWSTLQAIANTESMDLWFLVPFNAICRTLPREGNAPDSWREKLIRVLGEDPRPHLYEKQVQTSLFQDELEFALDDEREIRRGGTRSIGLYLINRLRDLFHGWVGQEVIVLRNSRNSPMFLLVFCVANPSPKAVALAKKALKGILKKHREGGGDVQGFGN